MLCFPLQNHYLSPQYWAYFELSALADIWDQSPNEFLETLLGKQTRGKVWRFSCLLLLKFSKKYFKVSTKWWPITNLYQRHSLSLFGYILEKKIQEEICEFLFRRCAKATSHCVHWIKCPISSQIQEAKFERGCAALCAIFMRKFSFFCLLFKYVLKPGFSTFSRTLN